MLNHMLVQRLLLLSLTLRRVEAGYWYYLHDSSISVGGDNFGGHANATVVARCQFGTGLGASIGPIDVGFIINVTFSDIVFRGTEQAVRIQSNPVSCCSSYYRLLF